MFSAPENPVVGWVGRDGVPEGFRRRQHAGRRSGPALRRGKKILRAAPLIIVLFCFGNLFRTTQFMLDAARPGGS